MMTGLRERQKAARNRRILEAASALFKQSGYEAVHIDAIAARAEVSVGTFYNYYQNKGDLLLATVTLEVEEVLSQGSAIVADPPADVAEALSRLIGLYYEHSLVWLTKEMWRTAMALSIRDPGTPFSRRYRALDARLRAQVGALLAEMAARGQARADLDLEALGQVIFNNLNEMFAVFVTDAEMEVEELNALVARQNAPLAALLTRPA